MKIYGIKTCDSVKKAIKFMKENNISYEFIDFKKTPVNEPIIERWLTQIPMDKLFNTKGTTYRTLKLKDLGLDDEAKKTWLSKENLLIKRPVIEYEGTYTVAYDEIRYKELFLA